MRPARTATAVAVAATLALLGAGCGTSGHGSLTSAQVPGSATATATATTEPSTAPRTATGPASTTAPPQASDRGAGPAGGPVPAGFHPVAFTAISADRFWLLGSAPCPTSVCTSIVRTTDGGAHFAGIPAPPIRLNGALATIAFADQNDGYVGRSDGAGAGTLWETHDGGAHWRLALSGLLSFTVGGGEVYAITGGCTQQGTCPNLRLMRSPATTDDWAQTALPSAQGGFPAITTHGDWVWLSLTPSSGTPEHQTLLVSYDLGAHLSERPSPCFGGLGGELDAASPKTVWAVCPGGMMSTAYVTHDGGGSWQELPGTGPSQPPGLELVNSARIAQASDTTAVISSGAGTELLRTIDGGRSFTRVVPRGSGDAHWMWLGFTDAQTGTGLLAVPGEPVGPDRVPPTQLWRSHDGGATWARLAIG